MCAALLLSKGARFIVAEDYETDALTSWSAPYTGSEHCVIPAGTILRVMDDVEERGHASFYKRKEGSPKPEPPYMDHVSVEWLALVPGLKQEIDSHRDYWDLVSQPVPSAFACVPENYDELHAQLIPKSTRTSPKYGGYYLVISFDEIGNHIRELPVSENACSL